MTIQMMELGSAGTELRGKNLVASRASQFKRLLALTKIQWPSIMRKIFWWMSYIPEQKNHMNYMGGQRYKPFDGKGIFALQ